METLLMSLWSRRVCLYGVLGSISIESLMPPCRHFAERENVQPFLPNEGSMRSRAAAPNVARQQAVTQRKKAR